MTRDAAPIVAVRGLECRFGHLAALRSVDLEVTAAEVVLLAGPNGAGKSTLLRTLAGLVRPSRGTVRIAGRDLRGTPEARSVVGLLSHQTMLYDDLTARENLRFAASLQRLDGVERRVMEALDAAGLRDRAGVRAGSLSHGMRRRLAIARATLHAPLLLLLDEPFSGLDAASCDHLRQRLAADAADGRTVICVTHQLAEFWQIATRVILLDQGSVVLDEPRPTEFEEFLATFNRLLAA